MAGGGLGGGDPTGGRQKFPWWMQQMGAPGPLPFQPQQIPGGQQTPFGLLGGGGPATSQLYGAGGGASPPATSQLYGGNGGGLPTFLNSLGPPSQGGNYATSQLFGGGPAPGGNASSQFGQFNPASQDFGAYLQSLMRRGQRKNVR